MDTGRQEDEAMSERAINNLADISSAIPRRDLSLHFLENEALLFDKARQEIYGLNSVAAFIWCCLEDGLSGPGIVRALCDTFALSEAKAGQHLASLLAQWRMMTPENGEVPPADLKSLMPPLRAAVFPGAAAVEQAVAAERHYRILDATIAIRFATPDLDQAIHPFIAHLAAKPGAAPTVGLDVVPDEDDIVFITEGREIDRCCGPEHVTAYTKMCLLLMALDRSSDFCAVHAAALDAGGRGLLMPGRSQSGKSTLAAALAAAGLRLMGDDTIVLAAETLDIRAVPFGISVKDGAWDVLAARFPRLRDLPVHVRPDGKRVRYLLPQMIDPIRVDHRVPVHWIVFPEYAADAGNELLPLSRPIALSRMLQGVTALGNGLDSAKIDRLVQWIGVADCHILRLSSLDRAVGILTELCR